VAGIARRLAEAERMGFRRAVIPAGSGILPGPDSAITNGSSNGSLQVIEVADVHQALSVVLGG